MPCGPQGQKRPADAIGNAIMVAQLATGELEETLKQPSSKVRSRQAGAAARSANMTKEQRSAVAKKAAAARWHEEAAE
jgi:hypothetical protein